MERRKEGKGWETFFEHWGLPLAVVIIGIFAMVLTNVLMLFIN
jgi:hypothetical protein